MNSTHNNSLTGKVAIVTGRSKGIEVATVLHLVSLGANVVFSYASDSAAADDLEAKIKSQYHPSSAPPRALAFKGDASSIPDIKALVAKTLQTYSRIDILILNAALGTVFEIADADEATFDTMMSVNIKGPFFLTKHVAPHLSAGSRIIFLSSALTVVSGVLPHQFVYVATKGAIEQMARVLAKDFGRRGINVNVISPGLTATELFYRGKREASVERIRGTIPMGREVAEGIGWLAGGGSRWVLDKTLGQMAEWRSFGCKVQIIFCFPILRSSLYFYENKDLRQFSGLNLLNPVDYLCRPAAAAFWVSREGKSGSINRYRNWSPRYTFLLYPYRLRASSNMHFHSIAGALPPIPDHLSIPQFFLDTQHAMRPERPLDAPWLVADKSGRAFGLDEVQARTNSLAVSLRDKYAIGGNNAVLFFTSNHIDYPICMWAVHRLLGIVTPCNPALTVPELVDTIKLSKAALIISHADNLDVVSAAAKQTKIPTSRIIVLEDQDAHNPFKSKYGPYTTVDSLIHHGSQSGEKIKEIRFRQGEAKEQVAFYSSSSGTTGPPKMVKISHFAFIADILISAALNKVGESSPRFVPGDRCLGVLPFYHIYGLNLILHFNFFAGITVIVIPKFNFPDMLKSIERYKINSLMVVPPQVVLLTKEPIVKKYDLSHVRVVVCAAAPLASELYDQLINLLPQAYIGQAYGSTEATGVVSMSSIHEKHGRHGGILAPGVEGRVVRHDGTLVGYDGEGELHIRTPAAAMGYLDNEIATRETFLHDSWMRTGDLVRIDKNEEIIVLDRVKEMIKVRGFQVAPAELEGCILDHPLVADVCVVGVPHPFNGEVPFAFVTLTEEGFKVSQSDLKASINKRVAENKAPFKHLHHIEVIDSIPKTPSGKLLRRDLREKARGLTATVRAAKL